MTGLIIFGSLLIGMFMGLPVCFALLAACLIYLIPSGIPLTIVPQTMIAGMNSFVLLAIPLFTMTGYLMEQTSLSRRLVDFVEALFCRSRGSMGVVTIVTCAIFAALTGSGPATVAAIGAIMMPALTRANYPKSTSAGMIAAGGALGPIIPPSANMVVYGAAMGLSVSKMFIGGVLPGIMMAIALCLVNVYLAAKYKFAKSDVRYPKKEVLRRTARAIPTLVLPVIILGGIYGGLVTPTEAAVQAVLNHGDKVLLPEPAWVSYESIVISAGAEAVKVPLSPADHYRLTEALLEQHYTPEVRLIIINYPNNPTGRILHQDEAEALSAFMQRHPDVLLLSDEVYDAIVYDGVRSISMASRPEVADRVITINGFSKFAAMTGWRMGYLTARRDIYAAIYKLYQQSVSCMSGFLQEGAVQAFRIPDEVEAMRQSYQRRRDAFVGRLNAIPGVHCQMPEGAFYAWVSFDVDMTSDEMCDYILDHAKVVGVSGAAYGMTQGCFLRFSFASDDAALSAAADRIEAAMRAYQQR